MKSEEEIKKEIDRLNDVWNIAFHSLQSNLLSPDGVEIATHTCWASMTEMLKLKWVLGYNYLAPEHTYKKENYEEESKPE